MLFLGLATCFPAEPVAFVSHFPLAQQVAKKGITEGGKIARGIADIAVRAGLKYLANACDPSKEDCEGMAGMGGDACAAYCKSYDAACQLDNADVCMPGLFWIAIWIIIILVGCVVQRLGLCYPVCKCLGCAKCAFKHCRGNKK